MTRLDTTFKANRSDLFIRFLRYLVVAHPREWILFCVDIIHSNMYHRSRLDPSGSHYFCFRANKLFVFLHISRPICIVHKLCHCAIPVSLSRARLQLEDEKHVVSRRAECHGTRRCREDQAILQQQQQQQQRGLYSVLRAQRCHDVCNYHSPPKGKGPAKRCLRESYMMSFVSAYWSGNIRAVYTKPFRLVSGNFVAFRLGSRCSLLLIKI